MSPSNIPMLALLIWLLSSERLVTWQKEAQLLLHYSTYTHKRKEMLSTYFVSTHIESHQTPGSNRGPQSKVYVESIRWFADLVAKQISILILTITFKHSTF